MKFALCFALLLGALAFPARAEDMPPADAIRLGEVNRYWMSRMHAAREAARGKIVILMMDSDEYRYRPISTLMRTLTVLEKSSPRALLIDIRFLPSDSGLHASLQGALDRLYPRVVWMGNDARLKRDGAPWGALSPGDSNIWPLKGVENSFGLIEPCDPRDGKSALPHAVFLMWEMSRGIYHLPYHRDCSRWSEEKSHAALKTFAYDGSHFVPAQYFGKDFFATFSSSALARGNVSPEEFRGKIVLVGTDLPDTNGRVDRHLMSVGMLDGTEMLAHALATLMSAP